MYSNIKIVLLSTYGEYVIPSVQTMLAGSFSSYCDLKVKMQLIYTGNVENAKLWVRHVYCTLWRLALALFGAFFDPAN